MSAAIDTFFGNFGELTEEAEQIPQVRAFIVSALLHESLNAGAANEVANQVRRQNQEAAAHQAATPTARRKKPVPELTTEDLPPQLQDLPIQLFGRLDEIATIEKGLSPIQKTKPGPYPLVVTAEERGSSETFEFVGPAVAIPMVSSTGHGDASLKRIHYQEGEFAAGNILSVVKPICPQTINARFLYEYLTAFKEELLVARMSGTANVSLTVNKLREVPVPLVTGPALQKLDALMAQCDRLEAQLRERDTRQAELARAALARFSEAPTPENLDLLFHDSFTLTPADLRKTILTLAVQGKLAANAGAESSERSTAEPFKIPRSWEWRTLADVMSIKHGYAFKSSNFTTDPQPYVLTTPGNFYEAGGFLDRGTKTKYFSDKPPENFVLSAGDLIIPMTEQAVGLLGSPAFIPNDGKKYLHNQRLGLIRLCSDELALSYVACFFKSPFFRKEIGDTASGMKVRHTSPKKILKIPIPIPPLAEQRRIVAKVDQLMALVDDWEVRLEQSRATAKNVLEALVAELTIHQTQ